MDGKLADAVLLTSHARVALANIEPFTLSLEHKSFTSTASLSFEVDDAQGAATQVATSFSGWFEYLQLSGVRSVFLRNGAGIGVSRSAGERVWQQSSDVIKPRPADGRIWAVRYRESDAKAVGMPEQTLAVRAARLLELLAACETLAREGGEAGWAKFFGNAQQELNPTSDAPLQNSHLLPPRGYSREAQRLLRGCELSWAFGGMGSWNDLEFGESAHRRRYSELTPQLYTAVLEGILAAVNSPLSADAND